MATLLLRLQAPMQSWGISSHFSVRDTCREPTKSGVIGLVCAALGLTRDAPLDEYTSLKMGVRVDREGKLFKDYHIAQNIYKASGKGLKASEPSNRYYLSDAVFLVGLEGDRKLLEKMQTALQNPKWSLYLGRKAFPPSLPIWLSDGLQEKPLLDVLRTFPLLAITSEEKLRLVIEDSEGSVLKKDVPVSFLERKFTSRYLSVQYIAAPDGVLREVEHVSVQAAPE
ncbi:MAG: type I-E CRISPR-associated protein Cas5/CasD [Pelolinea sp.]|nr:type I-E CRISPR-associated protein Cas5/CasD [Pelolinea sp.]